MRLETLPDWIRSVPAPLYAKVMGGSSIYKPGTPLTETPVFRVTLGAAEFSQKLQTLEKVSPAFRKEMQDRNRDSNWCGLTNENASDLLSTGKSQTAQTNMQAAKGKFDTPLVGGSLALKNRGPSFSMARVLQGHPIACIRREKNKLPPKTINLILQASSSVSHETITKTLARIVKAAIEYRMAGGVVSINMHYFSGFRKHQNGNAGLWTTLVLPLGNTATLATFASVQGYRALLLSLASVLSGDHADILPTRLLPRIPGAIPLSGVPQDETAALEALKLK